MAIPTACERALDRIVEELKERLGDNLYSCVLYGSAVRGEFVPKVSDLNLLLILKESTPEAHTAIAQAVRGKVNVDPFVISRKGMERSFEAFAIKFHSIRRDYRVVHGEDPLAELDIEPDLLRFLSEQALRNLRLRAVHAFIVFGHYPRRYQEFLLNVTPNVFIDLSEALRAAGTEVPHDFAPRIPVVEREIGTDGSILRELLDLKQRPRRVSSSQVMHFHSRLFGLLDEAVRWMENRWPKKQPSPTA